MNELEYRSFLEKKNLSQRTIKHYCDYINSIVAAHGLVDKDELVTTLEETVGYIERLVHPPMSLPVPSARCYRRALCLLYEFKHGEEIGREHFPNWNEDDVNEVRRKYEKEHPEHPSLWYQEIIVDDPHALLGVIIDFNESGVTGVRSWAFRGQGDAEWGLETSLGRVAHYEKGENHTKGDRLRIFEKETLWEFKRESAKRPEYRGFDGLDLLSLVQHYGGKTRLLDFTLAPLLALYMAVEQNEMDYSKVLNYRGLDERARKKVKRRDLAVWAVDLPRLMGASNSPESPKRRTVEDVFVEAEWILKEDGGGDAKGMYAIFPKTCNERISAQEGLFLMPKSLNCSFEDNLREELSRADGQTHTYKRAYLSEWDSTLLEGKNDSPAVVKFVFPIDTVGPVKRLLLEANVTAKHVYPDLTGLGRYVSNIIEGHCKEAQ